MKAVIPAAGLGIRFLPITKAQPKEMLPVGDKPAIQYVVEEAVNAGFDDILIVTGQGKRAIEDHFDKSHELERILKDKNELDSLQEIQKISNMSDMHYVRQKSQAGLGDAILCAKKHIGNEPFAVLLGDTITLSDTQPCIKSLYETYEKYKCSVIGVEYVPAEKVEQYGIISGAPVESGLFDIDGLVEKPSRDQAPSNLAIFGRYILTPTIFKYLEQTEAGFGGEIQLTDALQRMLQKEKIMAMVTKSKRYDIGKKIDWLLASVEISISDSKFSGLEQGIRDILGGKR